jgi:penicillin-binding protein 1A
MDTAQGIDRLLQSVVSEGTGEDASRAPNARGKTGTSSDYKDAWFVGYTNRFIGAVWVANQYTDEDGTVRRGTMASVMGGDVAAPMWGRLMAAVIDQYGDEPLKRGQSLDEARRIAERDEQEAERVQRRRSSDDRVFDPIPESEGRRWAENSSSNPDSGPPVDRSPIEEQPDTEVDPPVGDVAPGTGDFIYMTVCEDTGLLITSACPYPTRLPYQRGTQPTTRCSLHRR